MNHVAAGIISRMGKNGVSEYLLVRSNKDFGEYTGYWYPPAGHLEAGEDDRIALVREIEEELGLRIEPTRKIAETPADVKDETTYWWECNIVSGDMIIDADELAEAGYFTEQAMREMNIWPATRAFFQRYIFVNR